MVQRAESPYFGWNCSFSLLCYLYGHATAVGFLLGLCLWILSSVWVIASSSVKGLVSVCQANLFKYQTILGFTYLQLYVGSEG